MAEKENKNDLLDLISAISASFIKAKLDETPATIQAAINQLGALLDADRFYIFEYDFKQGTCSNTYEYCAVGIEPQIEFIQQIPMAYFPDWVEVHIKGECLEINDVSKLDPNSHLRQILEPQSIKSLITVPLMDGKTCLGFIGLDDIYKTHSFSKQEGFILTIFANLLVNLFCKIENDKQLLRSNFELKERLKELKCLFEISTLNDTNNLSVEAYFQSLKQTIKNAFQFPEKTSVEILFQDHIYQTPNCVVSANFITDNLIVLGSSIGKITVYLETELPFLTEEKDLLNAIKISIENHWEKSQINNTLKQSEERLSKIIETETSYVLRTDLNGKPTYWNNTFQKTFGWIFESIEESKRSSLDSIKEYHRKRATDTVMACMANPGKTIQVELDKPTPSGGNMSTLWEFVCLTDEQNNPTEIQCMGQDITFINQANNEIQKKEELYRSLLESNDSSIILVNKNGTLLFLNKIASYRFQKTPEDLIGSSIFDIFSKEESDNITSELNWVITHNQGKEIETELSILDQQLFFRTSYQPVRNSEGKVESVLVNATDITSFKQAQQKLIESESQYKALFELSLDSYLIIEQGVFTDCNQATLDLLCCDKDFIIGKNPEEISPEYQNDGQKSSELVAQYLNEAFKVGYKRFEWTHLKKDGSDFMVDMSLTPMMLNHKSVVFISWRDISANKIAEKNLRISENRLSQVAETSLTVIWEMDPKGMFTYVNSVSKEVYGYEPHEIIGKKYYSDLYPENLKNTYIQYAQKQIEEGKQLVNEEVKLLQKNGKVIWVSKNIAAVRNKKGEITSYRGSDSNISSRKQAEANALIFRNVADQANYGAALVTLDGILTYQNNMVAEMHGYAMEEIQGKHLSIFHNEKQLPEVFNLLELIKNEGGFKATEVGHCKKDGSEFPCLMSAKVVTDDENNPLYLSATMIDITEAKLKEAEIIDLNENLELKIVERTKELTESTILLKQAIIVAESANKAKSEFLSRMSHEFRTPLNSILGFAQLIQMGKMEPSVEKGIKHILKGGRHLLDLVNEILDLSRIEAGVITLSLEPVNIHKLAKETVEDLTPLSKNKNIKVTLSETWNPNCQVMADKQRLKQVVINLINNSLKYNHNGGKVWIDFKTYCDETTNQVWIRLSVNDNGIGVSQKDLERIFNPFERINADVSGTEGTGLGLSVVKQLVELMQGRIGVTSKLNSGSTFWIELPATLSPIDSPKQLVPYFVQGETFKEIKGTILYTEDNLSNIELVKRTLEINYPQVKLVNELHGRNTLKLAVELKPDIILLDLNLSDMHGISVLHQLKEHPETAQIPVIIISADSTPLQIDKLLISGASNYLTKPIDLKSFLREISKHLFKKNKN